MSRLMQVSTSDTLEQMLRALAMDIVHAFLSCMSSLLCRVCCQLQAFASDICSHVYMSELWQVAFGGSDSAVSKPLCETCYA